MKVSKSQSAGTIKYKYRYTVLYLDQELVQVGAKSLVNRVDTTGGLEKRVMTMCTSARKLPLLKPLAVVPLAPLPMQWGVH